jgi:hypothetical protein
MAEMTSKARLQAAMRHEPVDHLPLTIEGVCHGWTKFANDRYPDKFERAKFYAALGLDGGGMYGSPVEPLPESVEIREWAEQNARGETVLHKEYLTPAGTLQQVVRCTEDYRPLEAEWTPSRAKLPIFSDHHVPPTRSQRYLVETAEDLDSLEYLLGTLNPATFAPFVESFRAARGFCDEQQILLSMYAAGVGDPLLWMSGIERTLLMAMEEKATLGRYVDIVARWNRQTIELAIAAGVDHIVRRGWYESTDFWSPALYREFLLEPLKQDVALAHEAGVTVDYVMASGSAALLGMIAEAGVDMLSNLDPVAPGTDLRAYREQIGDDVALCGGVNNYMVLEAGTEAETRQATLAAIEAFTPGTGCVLAPSDCLFLGDPALVERNLHVMIDTWKEAAW